MAFYNAGQGTLQALQAAGGGGAPGMSGFSASQYQSPELAAFFGAGGGGAAAGGGMGGGGGMSGMGGGGSTLADLSGQYSSAYNSARALNQANAQSIAQGYRSLMAGQQSSSEAIARGYPQLANQIAGGLRAGNAPIQAGYDALSRNVLAGIAGVGQSQGQEITDAYAQQRGATNQSMISRGLGNTTVTDSAMRGLTLDEQKARISLANQLAQLRAGYQSQLGLAGLGFGERAVGEQARYGTQIGLSGLGYQGQAAMQNSQLGQAGLAWQNSISAPYPQASQYAQLAQQYGAQQQAGQGAPFRMPEPAPEPYYTYGPSAYTGGSGFGY